MFLLLYYVVMKSSKFSNKKSRDAFHTFYETAMVKLSEVTHGLLDENVCTSLRMQFGPNVNSCHFMLKDHVAP